MEKNYTIMSIQNQGRREGIEMRTIKMLLNKDKKLLTTRYRRTG